MLHGNPTNNIICNELMRANEAAEPDTDDDDGGDNDDRPPSPHRKRLLTYLQFSERLFTIDEMLKDTNDLQIANTFINKATKKKWI